MKIVLDYVSFEATPVHKVHKEQTVSLQINEIKFLKGIERYTEERQHKRKVKSGNNNQGNKRRKIGMVRPLIKICECMSLRKIWKAGKQKKTKKNIRYNVE